MPHLSVLIKPASSLCNMGCKYCFYCDVAKNRNTRSFGIMSEETVNAMIKNIFSYADVGVSFAFQGGEPTLAGEDFYRIFHSAVERYNVRRVPTSFFLQTNGYNISDGLIEIFRKNRYLLGVSLDGEKDIHDSLRTTVSGEPTFDRICENLRRLDASGVEYNILTVVTEDIAKKGAEVYKSLRDNGYRYLQFIPYVSDFGREEERSDFSLTNDSYAYFLNETFREYHKDFVEGGYVSVRDFDNFVRIAAGGRAERCGMDGRCYANLVVEADGSVYPCDFYVLDKWKMGNITDTSIRTLLSSNTAAKFVNESLSLPAECRRCPYVSVCKGGCRRHREAIDGSLILNRYCAAYKSFFETCLPLILDIAGRLYKK